MPDWIAERCILAGCRLGGAVLDPFAGSCTTGRVANMLGRAFVGIELHQPYLDLALRTRLAQGALVPEVGGSVTSGA
jgi:DNA modification methylase